MKWFPWDWRDQRPFCTLDFVFIIIIFFFFWEPGTDSRTLKITTYTEKIIKQLHMTKERHRLRKTWEGVIFILQAEIWHRDIPKQYKIKTKKSSLGGARGSYFAEVVIQSLSRVRLFVIPWTGAHQASLPFTISQSLLQLMSIESAITFNHLILCHPLLLLPSIFLSIRVFSNELALYIRWPKYWSFSFRISPSNE